MYIDESGINEYLYREKCWAKKGERIIGEVSGKKFKRINMIAGKCKKKIHALYTYEGNMNGSFFNIWLRECLLPEVGPGKVIVMDNASFHKNKDTKKIIADAECKLIYLPPYSPDLNPIEKFWSWLKREIKSIAHNFTCLYEMLKMALLKQN